MDRAEAIKRLNKMRRVCDECDECNVNCDLCEEALDLAIESLMLRDKYVEALERMIEGAKEINKSLDEAAKKSDQKLQLSGETSTNTSTCNQKQVTGKLESAENATSKGEESTTDQPKSKLDCISRQQAIEAMWKALYAYEDLTEKQFMEHEELELGDWFQHRIFVQRAHEECMKSVESLPPVTPTERTGEWMVEERDSIYGKKIRLTCSECGDVFDVTEAAYPYERYCRYCGAKMGGDTE